MADILGKLVMDVKELWSLLDTAISAVVEQLIDSVKTKAEFYMAPGNNKLAISVEFDSDDHDPIQVSVARYFTFEDIVTSLIEKRKEIKAETEADQYLPEYDKDCRNIAMELRRQADRLDEIDR